MTDKAREEIALEEQLFQLVTNPPCHSWDTGTKQYCDFWDIQGHYCFWGDARDSEEVEDFECPLVTQAIEIFKELGYRKFDPTKLTLSPITYKRGVYSAYNTDSECFEAGKREQLDHDRNTLEGGK